MGRNDKKSYMLAISICFFVLSYLKPCVLIPYYRNDDSLLIFIRSGYWIFYVVIQNFWLTKFMSVCLSIAALSSNVFCAHSWLNVNCFYVIGSYCSSMNIIVRPVGIPKLFLTNDPMYLCENVVKSSFYI